MQRDGNDTIRPRIVTFNKGVSKQFAQQSGMTQSTIEFEPTNQRVQGWSIAKWGKCAVIIGKLRTALATPAHPIV